MEHKQLELTPEILLEIGFKEVTYPADESSSERTTFEIDSINGKFIYNPSEPIYKWYHKTEVGEVSNYVHLDIIKAAELFMVLSVFRVKYNLIIM